MIINRLKKTNYEKRERRKQYKCYHDQSVICFSFSHINVPIYLVYKQSPRNCRENILQNLSTGVFRLCKLIIKIIKLKQQKKMPAFPSFYVILSLYLEIFFSSCRVKTLHIAFIAINVQLHMHIQSQSYPSSQHIIDI